MTSGEQINFGRRSSEAMQEGGHIFMVGRNEVPGDPVHMSLIQYFADLFEVIESLFEFIMLALLVL